MLGVALDVKLIAPLAAEELNSGFVGREFVGRQQVDGLHFLQRALGIGIKQAQAVDFVVEKVQTIRLFTAHRVEVEQRAAGGVLPVLHDLIDMAIARAVELYAQAIP